jgi:hypothetical protein
MTGFSCAEHSRDVYKFDPIIGGNANLEPTEGKADASAISSGRKIE